MRDQSARSYASLLDISTGYLAMIPTVLVLSIYKGQTFNDVLTFEDENGRPIDLTGITVLMQARTSVDAPDPPLLSFGTGDGTITVDNVGNVTFAVSAAATTAIVSGFDIEQWVYDMKWIHPGGVVERPIEGALVIYPEVTR
jgi:hypothetical protein